MYSFNQFCYFPLIYSFKHLEVYSFIHLGSFLYFLPPFTDPVFFFFSFFGLFSRSVLSNSCSQTLSIGLFRQEYWSGLPFPPLGNLPDPRTEPASPVSLALQAYSLPTEPSGKPSDPVNNI